MIRLGLKTSINRIIQILLLKGVVIYKRLVQKLVECLVKNVLHVFGWNLTLMTLSKIPQHFLQFHIFTITLKIAFFKAISTRCEAFLTIIAHYVLAVFTTHQLQRYFLADDTLNGVLNYLIWNVRLEVLRYFLLY